MIAKLQSLTVNGDGTQSITLSIMDDFRDSFDDMKGRYLDLDIRPHYITRSKNANAYFHCLCGEISQETGEKADAVKERIVSEYGAIRKDAEGNAVYVKVPRTYDIRSLYPYTRYFDTVIENNVEYNCFLILKSTHEMTTKEMSRLIDGAEEEAKELGINPNPSLVVEQPVDTQTAI